MEEEIDLRQYVTVLIKYKTWIIGLGILAALAAFIVSSAIPDSYEATALVTATQSRYELQFDPRFRNLPDVTIQFLLEPTLATSDELLQQLAEQTGVSLEELQVSVSANAQDTSNLLALTVSGQEPQTVATIANAWAELFGQKITALYGGEEQAHFSQQQQTVAQSLAEADAALTSFREKNGFGFIINTSNNNDGNNNDGRETEKASLADFGLIGQRLQAKNQLLTNYETELTRLQQMQREVELLLSATNADSSPVLIAGLLSEMINSGIVKDSQPFQIKLDSVEPEAGLKAMTVALQSRVVAVAAEMENLRTDIASLQSELATKQEQLEQLIREQSVKAETFFIISRKVQEAQIDVSGEDSSGTGKVQIASRAAIPTASLSSGRLRNTVVAGLLGLMVGVFGAFILEWWRSEPAEPDQQQSEAAPALSVAPEFQD